MFEITRLFVKILLLTKDSHDVVENSRFQLLLFEKSSDNDCIFERFDVKDVVDEL